MSEIRAVCPQHVPSIRVDSNDMTYEAMFAVGVTQLRVGAPGIVLESPLGRVALGERALQITKEAQALCVLVDCYAEKAVWEERLAKRASQSQFRPTNVHQIESNYANIEYKIECDAHIRIDCGLPTAKNVKRVAQTIQQLLYDEGTIDRSPSME